MVALKRFDLLTIFPEFFDSYWKQSLVGKALKKGLFRAEVHQLRRWAYGKHLKVDDIPYGGGRGMVFRPEPLTDAISAIKKEYRKGRVIYLSCQGSRFDQKKAEELLNFEEILFVCGRYEGIDQRVIDTMIDEEISVGDFVLSGGEVAALVVLDAMIRMIPGVVGHADSLLDESFQAGILEYPHYTRPEEFRGLRVPDVLLSGNHAEIHKWRLEKALEKTKRVRGDLLWNRVQSKP